MENDDLKYKVTRFARDNNPESVQYMLQSTIPKLFNTIILYLGGKWIYLVNFWWKMDIPG